MGYAVTRIGGTFATDRPGEPTVPDSNSRERQCSHLALFSSSILWPRPDTLALKQVRPVAAGTPAGVSRRWGGV